MPIGRGAKAKGDHYERQLARYFNEHLGLKSWRTPLSGGGRYEAEADLQGTPGLAIEAKRCETMKIPEWYRQAVKNAGPDVPVVITRKSRVETGESFVVLNLDNFKEFYGAWLREKGHING